MSLFQAGKKFLNKYPWMTKLSSQLYYILNFNQKSIKGKTNIIIHNKSFLNQCKFKVTGNNNKIIVGDKCFLKNCGFIIHGNNNVITLSDMVCAYDAEFYIEDDGNSIEIGERTLICGSTHLACIEGTEIKVGTDCLFSSDIVLRTGDSHTILDSYGNRINASRSIFIDNHVWIGNKVIVTKGVHIMKNSVVATGAVVTKGPQLPNVIIGGVPAGILKSDINWERERI